MRQIIMMRGGYRKARINMAHTPITGAHVTTLIESTNEMVPAAARVMTRADINPDCF